MKAWVVRSGGQDVRDFSCQFWSASVVAIGFGLGDLSQVTTRDEIRDKLRAVDPEGEDEKRKQEVGNVYRFVKCIAVDDLILASPTKRRGHVLVGYCRGPYRYAPELVSEELPGVRDVGWRRTVSWSDLPDELNGPITGRLTVYDFTRHIERINGLLEMT